MEYPVPDRANGYSAKGEPSRNDDSEVMNVEALFKAYYRPLCQVVAEDSGAAACLSLHGGPQRLYRLSAPHEDNGRRCRPMRP